MATERRPFLTGLVQDLAALGSSPRELWLVYAINFFECIAYFAIYNLLVVYLSEDLGYADVGAGSIVGTWLTAISLVMFFSGFLADSIGIRRALLLGILSCLVGRFLLAVGHTRAVALSGLFVMTYGIASQIPTMTAAVRRFTTPETVSFGFSLFYVVMNVGAFAAAQLVAVLRRTFVHPQVVWGVRMTSSQLVFSVGAVATCACLLLVAFMRDESRLANAGQPASAAPRRNPVAIFLEVVGERAFWRFMLFVSLLVLVRLIFQHAHQTWPKYTLREFGERFPFAAYWSINPLLIIFMTPIVTALTRERSAFATIVIGGVISALSVFFLVASTTVTASVLFIVTLSLGEALWSPRLYEYTSVIAPRGREASYMGLSQVPMFLAKPIVGFTSGLLLATYCPKDGPRSSPIMWAIIGATTLVGPFLIYILRNVIAPRQATAAGPLAAGG